MIFISIYTFNDLLQFVIIIVSLLMAACPQVHTSVLQVHWVHADSVRVDVYYYWPSGYD